VRPHEGEGIQPMPNRLPVVHGYVAPVVQRPRFEAAPEAKSQHLVNGLATRGSGHPGVWPAKCGGGKMKP
jgi:hypothetical protein